VWILEGSRPGPFCIDVGNIAPCAYYGRVLGAGGRGVDLWKPRAQVFLGWRRPVGLEPCRVQ
jgi:hypothetical protein